MGRVSWSGAGSGVLWRLPGCCCGVEVRPSHRTGRVPWSVAGSDGAAGAVHRRRSGRPRRVGRGRGGIAGHRSVGVSCSGASSPVPCRRSGGPRGGGGLEQAGPRGSAWLTSDRKGPVWQGHRQQTLLPGQAANVGIGQGGNGWAAGDHAVAGGGRGRRGDSRVHHRPSSIAALAATILSSARSTCGAPQTQSASESPMPSRVCMISDNTGWRSKSSALDRPG